MPNLNDEIRKLKNDGMSLRAIAVVARVSHTTVMRRLREMEQVSSPGIVAENVTEENLSNLHPSRICRGSEDTVSHVSHKKTLSPASDSVVTPRTKASRGPSRPKKEGNPPRSDQLVGHLIRFLEGKGLEVYPMQSGGFQVKGTRETVRFYISRRDGSAVGRLKEEKCGTLTEP
jgi:hypothetical protein